jgi:hypothetical protein
MRDAGYGLRVASYVVKTDYPKSTRLLSTGSSPELAEGSSLQAEMPNPQSEITGSLVSG